MQSSEKFKDDVTNTMTFKVGYYEGQTIKIVTNEDLKAMFETMWLEKGES